MATKKTVVRTVGGGKAAVGEFAAAVADIGKALDVKPPFDVTVGEEALKKDLIALLPQIKAGDPLTPATWKTLKAAGWVDQKPKRAATKAPAPAAAEPKAGKAKASTKAKAEKKSAVEVDQFGFRLDSGRHSFAMALVKAPHTMAEIQQMAWNTTHSSFGNTWRKLKAKGLGKIDDKGRMAIVKK
jgi:hypothetical protein